MKKLLIIVLVFGSISSTMAQKSINDYKYVIVPYKYDFVNEKDKYQLNSLSQFLFNKYGFNAIMEDGDFPDDLIKNRCLALRSDVVREKGMFNTKLKVELKNCNGEVIHTTKIGTSREKQYQIAYTMAIREAFKDFETVNYKYQPNENILAKARVTEASLESSNEEVKKLREELDALKEKQIVMADVSKKELIVDKVSENVKEVEEVVSQEDSKWDALYAQKIDSGYQLVDKTPKVVMILLETSKADVFLVKDKNALVYKEDGFWYLSKNNGENISIKTLNIKF